MTIVIRSATAADEARCLALIAQLTGDVVTSAWQATYRRLLDGARGAIHVADEAGAILGIATASYNLAIRYAGEYAQLEELIVDPAARGKNVGGLLVQGMLEGARAHGCAEAGLYLVPTTESNRAFYEKYGFRVVGTEMRQSIRGMEGAGLRGEVA